MGLFNKGSKLPPVEYYPCYEATDSAFLNARDIVLEVIKFKDYPNWAIVGDDCFISYLAQTKNKLPDKEFNFIGVQKDAIWDSFSSYLMRPEVGGAWNEETFQEVLEILISKFSQMPKEYKPAGSDWVNASSLILLSLDRALKTGRQILAQPIIEYVLIIWLHYCLNSGAQE